MGAADIGRRLSLQQSRRCPTLCGGVSRGGNGSGGGGSGRQACLTWSSFVTTVCVFVCAMSVLVCVRVAVSFVASRLGTCARACAAFIQLDSS